MMSPWKIATSAALVALSVLVGSADAQPFGVELHNTLMPASGGMGGVAITRPQDLLAGINSNPATMTQFDGTCPFGKRV